MVKYRNSQVGIEYLIIIGLVTFVITIILLTAFYYSNSAKDVMKINQIESFGNKIIADAETISYYGYPAKVSVQAYLPEGVISLEVFENSLIITTQTSTGVNKRAFASKVPIIGNLSPSWGIKKIKLEVLQDGTVQISNV